MQAHAGQENAEAEVCRQGRSMVALWQHSSKHMQPPVKMQAGAPCMKKNFCRTAWGSSAALTCSPKLSPTPAPA